VARRDEPGAPRGSGGAGALAAELRALYQGELADFTPARDALAKRLKASGDARHAEVKALRKPSLSAWAVNRLFGVEARAMAALVGAGERARVAQARAATAKDAAALRTALDAIRDETAKLLARGRELLSDGGKPPGDAILERLRWNLDALALEPGTAPLAARGWLDEDLAPPDFTVLAALQVAAQGAKPVRAPAPAPPSAKPGSRGATVHSFDRGRLALEERRRREGEERRARARDALARAEREAEARRAEATSAAATSEAAAKEAAAAQERALAARKAAHEAEATAATAEATLRRAREALAAIERER